jgi:hypothetical protein
MSRAKRRNAAAPLPDYAAVRLAKPHTHAGQDHLPSETITVSAADARWLIDNGIGTAVATGNQEEH